MLRLSKAITNSAVCCSGNQIKVTLWGDQATNFSIDDAAAGNVIVCLLLGTIPRRVYDDYGKHSYLPTCSTHLLRILRCLRA